MDAYRKMYENTFENFQGKVRIKEYFEMTGQTLALCFITLLPLPLYMFLADVHSGTRWTPSPFGHSSGCVTWSLHFSAGYWLRTLTFQPKGREKDKRPDQLKKD